VKARLGWGREHVALPPWSGADAPQVFVPAISTQPPADLAFEARAALAAACRAAGVAGGGAPRSLLVVVPDRTRPAPVRAALAALWPAVAERRIPAEHVRLAIASGSHRPDPLDVTHERLGPLPLGVGHLVHDPADATQHRGTTAAGTPARVHPALADGTTILGIGGIAFHWFAGFGGGWKLFFPGLAAREAIAANHRLSLAPVEGLAPGVAPGRLDGNPVAEDLRDVAALLPPAAVWTLWDDGARSAVDRSPHEFAATCARYAKTRRVGPAGAADRVIASAGGWPRDLDVVQAHKALRHAAAYARPGAPITFLAACSEGLGSATLERWLARGDRAAVERGAREAYELNAQTALSLLGLAAAHPVTWVAQQPQPALERHGIRVVLDADAALAAVAPTAATVVLPLAGEVLPEEAA
jgi:hypothetical protein